MNKIILLIAVTVTLSSCGIYTTYHDAEEVPENLYGENVVTEDTTSIATIGWRELFTDPYLQSLIEQGLENNTDLLSAEQRVKEAQATLLSSKLAYLPSFAFSPSGTITKNNNYSPSTIHTYSLPISASWQFDLFGNLRNAKRQAQALRDQARDYEQAVRTQVIASIANVYYTLLMLDEQIAISKETAEASKQTVNSARALMKAGQYNEAGVASLEASYLSVLTSLADLEESLNATQNSMALLLAETPRYYVRGKLADQQFTTDVAVGIPLQLLSNRPDVRYAERALESAFYATNAARSAFYPSITLTGSLGWQNTSSYGSKFGDPIELVSSAVASLTQPLFQRGQLLGQLKIAKAQQEEARLSFQQTLLEAGTEVNEALTQYQTAHHKSELYEKQIAALETAYKSTALLMEYGDTNYIEVLSAQQSFLSGRLTQVANRTTEIQGLITLYQALGGGCD